MWVISLTMLQDIWCHLRLLKPTFTGSKAGGCTSVVYCLCDWTGCLLKLLGYLSLSLLGNRCKVCHFPPASYFWCSHCRSVTDRDRCCIFHCLGLRCFYRLITDVSNLKSQSASQVCIRVLAVAPVSMVQHKGSGLHINKHKVGRKICVKHIWWNPLIILDMLFRFSLSSYTDCYDLGIFVLLQQSRW